MFFRAYDRLIDALAFLAGLALFLVFASIVVIVSLRAIGVFMGTAANAAFALTEYSMLFIGTLAAPWLLREKGHVCIEFVRGRFGPRGKAVLSKVAYTIGLVVSLIVVVYALKAMHTNWGEWELRAFKVYKQWLIAPVGLSFLLLAVGFVRLLMGRGTIYEDSDIPIPDKGI
jgi:TRAP-type C4-dicarboxylate transport system permease small subunit